MMITKKRLSFCRCTVDKMDQEEFFQYVMFTNEATFHNDVASTTN